MQTQQQKRRRGVILSPQGLYKLQEAREQAEYRENGNQRFTLDKLNARTNLDAHTLCKILNSTTRVDRKSLIQCFKAFHLSLEPDDYELSPVPPPLARLKAQATENCKASASLTELTAESAFYDRNSGRVVIQLRYGATFSFSAALGQGLAGASPDDLADIKVTPSGTGLHWEKLDADLSVPALLNGIYGNEAWMATIATQQATR